MGEAHHKAWDFGNFTLLAPFTESFLLLLLNDVDKIAVKIGLQQIADSSTSSLVENTLVATPFTMSSFDNRRCGIAFGCMVGVKNVISTARKDTNYTTQVHCPFIQYGCEHVGQGDH
ncbi:hypothetical protein GOP47_0004611 [Adiantum capillus-veneris]|uniref:Uncharacterized protein n=1 Tax=Adiantum capillus-veneris TaxID=13818 RepID=A0A9D4ZMS6_ADICA|nr:hypothetical protein GOP47_0004611 [Adiantum capillus-veneris]